MAEKWQKKKYQAAFLPSAPRSHGAATSLVEFSMSLSQRGLEAGFSLTRHFSV